MQSELSNLREEKDKEVKTLLTRCQDAEKKMQLEGAVINVAQLAIANAVPSPASSSTNQVVIELTNNLEQLKSEVSFVLAV